MAHAKRPEWELFDVQNDPYCLKDLMGNPDYTDVEKEMKDVLLNELKKSNDPRIVGPDKEVFDSYIRYSPIRDFPKPEGAE